MIRPPEPARLAGEPRFGRSHLALLALSFFAMLADGFDIAALASAAPALGRAWHLEPRAFAPALTASLVGILVGAPLLGFVGDRYGRRIAVIAGSLLFGLATLATVAASDLSAVMVLRFFAGIGIGGLMPNLIALNTELQPRRWRATMIVLMFTGITVGSGLPGAIQAWVIPQHGWQAMFVIGGVVPLFVTVLLALWLPESPTVQSAQEGPSVGGTGLAQLFAPGLRAITVLLWLSFASALMANYFLVSWLPLLLETHGLTPAEAGLATSLYHYGGTLGGVIVSLVLARFGFAAIALLFVLAVPAVASIGTPGLGYGWLATTIGWAGFFVLGSQFGNNAASGLLYPAPVRARGVGWALGIGRFGSIAGPLVGGHFIAQHAPLSKMFQVAAIPLAVGVLAAAGVAVLRHRQGSLALGD